MRIRDLILNCPKYLNVFDELKYIMGIYNSVMVGIYILEKAFFLQFSQLFILLLFQPEIYEILSVAPPEGALVNQALLLTKNTELNYLASYIPC